MLSGMTMEKISPTYLPTIARRCKLLQDTARDIQLQLAQGQTLEALLGSIEFQPLYYMGRGETGRFLKDTESVEWAELLSSGA
jgi:hypothetical protein